MIKLEIRKSEKVPGLLSAFLEFGTYKKEWEDSLKFYEDKYHKHTLRKERKILYEFSLLNIETILDLFRHLPISIKYIHNRPSLDITIPDDYTFKIKPFKHQLEGIIYALNNKCFILGDDQGLGKTKEIIETVSILKKLGMVRQCLIITCVGNLRFNWEEEIKTHSYEESFILGTRYTKRKNIRYIGTYEDRLEDLKNRKELFLITNINTLLYQDFVDYLLSNKHSIDFIAVDEAHKVNNAKLKTGSQMANNLQKIDNIGRRVPMTGTLIRNSPIDSYAMLKWTGYTKASYSSFRDYFEDVDSMAFGGYRNLDVLKQMIDKAMLRRTKEEVLDLPEKLRHIEYVEMNDKQKIIYKEAWDWAYKNIDLIVENPFPLAQLIRLRQATGYTGILSSTIQESAKLDRVFDLVDEIVSSGKKALVISIWTDITTEAMRRLQKFNPVLIDGSLNDIQKNEQKNKFQNDPEIKVLVGQATSVGVGLTLTAASYVFFLDEPWTWADKLQIEDRIHRIGTTGTVNIVTLITKGTYDEFVHELVLSKKAMGEMLIGKNSEQKKEYLKGLLEQYKID